MARLQIRCAMVASAAASVGLMAVTAYASSESQAMGGGFFERVWKKVEEELTAAAEQNRRKPPVPVAVTWRKRKAVSVELGNPVLALASASDLNKNGTDEIVALTTKEVIVVERQGPRKVEIIARVMLPVERAAVRSRDPVGTLVVTPTDILARTSEQARGVALRWSESGLSVTREITGYPLCDDGGAELVAGRNYFERDSVSWTGRDSTWRDVSKRFFAASCRSKLVAPDGAPVAVFGFVDTDRVLHVACRQESGPCLPGPAAGQSYPGVGYAFDVADVDNDGVPEVVTTRGQPPGGDFDRVTVYGVRGAKVVSIFNTTFLGGIVGVVTGDIDGNGTREVVAGVRNVGETRVVLWTLN